MMYGREATLKGTKARGREKCRTEEWGRIRRKLGSFHNDGGTHFVNDAVLEGKARPTWKKTRMKIKGHFLF